MRQLFFKSFLSIIILIVFYSCSTKKQEAPEVPEPVVEIPKYSLAGEGVHLKWTAYKFTEKAGVSGTFDQVTVEPKNNSGTMQEIVDGTEFQVITRSVNTNMPMRDDRIYNSLFATINADTIAGSLTATAADQGTVSMGLGAYQGEASFEYKLEMDTIVISTSINLEAWEASSGVEALNEACKLEHTGTDGVSKLWPDVDITIKVPVAQAMP